MSQGGKFGFNPGTNEDGKNRIRENNVIQALLDVNILYKSKYYDVVHVDNEVLVKRVLKAYIGSMKELLSVRESIEYGLYKKSNGLNLGSAAFPSVELSVSQEWSKGDYPC